jgi:hypothetical protein
MSDTKTDILLNALRWIVSHPSPIAHSYNIVRAAKTALDEYEKDKPKMPFPETDVPVTLTGEEWTTVLARMIRADLSPKGRAVYHAATKKLQAQLLAASNANPSPDGHLTPSPLAHRRWKKKQAAYLAGDYRKLSDADLRILDVHGDD